MSCYFFLDKFAGCPLKGQNDENWCVSWIPRVLIQAGQESNHVQQRCTGCIASCLHLLASRVCAAGMCRPFSSQNWVQPECRKGFWFHLLCPPNTCLVFSQIAGDINLRHLETCLWENASNERTSWLCILIHQPYLIMPRSVAES